ELLLPIFPRETILITPLIGVYEHDDTIFYLQSGLPIYSHPKESVDHFRYFTAKLITLKRCRQTDIVNAFHVSSDSVARSVKLFQDEGESGFFGEDQRHGKSHKMLPERIARIQKMLDNGVSGYRAAKKEKISEGTIRYWIAKGKIKKNNKQYRKPDLSN
ncbi:MAG: hypothetical protein HY738_23535, partial [Bacteroidia bacterium]|nr:hypothetical protein [Bacteroidia bacterium]